MLLSMIVPLVVLLVVVGVVVLALARGRDGIDLSPRNVLRGYLYLASLAGVGMLVIGLAALLSWGIASTAGPGAAYGRMGEGPRPELQCPPHVDPSRCPKPEEIAFRNEQQRAMTEARNARRAAEDLVRGITFGAFGLALWAGHRAARRRVPSGDEPGSVMRRTYLLGGLVVFGLAAVVALPMGVYQTLVLLLLPQDAQHYIQGIAEPLSIGLAALPAWLLYLRALLGDSRAESSPARAAG